MHVTIVIISKNEPDLGRTLDDLARHVSAVEKDVLVVDASKGRMRAVQEAHPDVTWVDFVRPAGLHKRVTIPEQRNTGVRAAVGDVIVFTDSGCRPDDGWLDALVAPIAAGRESVTAGSFHSLRASAYEGITFTDRYVEEAPTLNLAFTRQVFEAVAGFDEDFSYCSDMDFCWRVNDAGFRIRVVAAAGVGVDWGDDRRQNKRAWYYGAGRTRCYLKHPARLRTLARRDPILVVYPAFLVGLPLTLLAPWYPLLLLVPMWRNRSVHPVKTVMDHLCYGAGALAHLARVAP